jgi:hypothetical protein
MSSGDGVVFYSPKIRFENSKTKDNTLQAFTAIGEIKGEALYQVEMTKDFTPWRKDVLFYAFNKEASILPLVPKFKFITNKEKWGAAFRYGFLQIQKEDFDLIYANMGADADIKAEASSKAKIEQSNV